MTEKKKKKVRFSKKVFLSLLNKEFGNIWNAIRGLYKEIRDIQGDIPATIELKQLEKDHWNLIIKAVEGEQYCDLKGSLSMIFHMGVFFRRIYNWDVKEEKEEEIIDGENKDE